MISLTALWIPLLVSAVAVFITSSILHMVLPWHKSDYRKLPDEEKITDALRAAGVTPGPTYHFPHCTHKEMKLPETVAKFTRGPVGLLTIIPSGPPNMGKYLGLWFLYCVMISVFVGYLTGITRAAGSPFMEVFRVAGTIAILGYAASQIQDSIWKAQAWSVTAKHVFDGVIYGLVTAAVFAHFWPK